MVPMFNKKVTSILSLIEKGYTFVIKRGFCFVLVPNQKYMHVRAATNNLFYITIVKKCHREFTSKNSKKYGKVRLTNHLMQQDQDKFKAKCTKQMQILVIVVIHITITDFIYYYYCTNVWLINNTKRIHSLHKFLFCFLFPSFCFIGMSQNWYSVKLVQHLQTIYWNCPQNNKCQDSLVSAVTLLLCWNQTPIYCTL